MKTAFGLLCLVLFGLLVRLGNTTAQLEELGTTVRKERTSFQAQFEEKQALYESEIQACNDKREADSSLQSLAAFARETALKSELTRYREATESDPRKWFAAYSGAVAERSFRARLDMTWLTTFSLKTELAPTQSLLSGRAVEEQQVTLLQTSQSAGFLLGRRSNFVFGLIQVSPNDPALQTPSFALPGPAEVEVPLSFNYFAEYELSSRELHLGVEILEGCGGGPSVVLHSWRTEQFIALVIGCESSTGALDIPIFPYEGFERWTRLTGTPLPLPLTTPAGAVSMAQITLDRKYAETGQERTAAGMPASVTAAFLPLEEGERRPVLHSMIFQIDEGSQVWLPFWAVRKQLASARENDWGLDKAFGLPDLRMSPAQLELRRKMLSSYQNLINFNQEHAEATSSPPPPP